MVESSRSGVALCMPTVQPRVSALRDAMEPVSMLSDLMAEGCSVDFAQQIVLTYYKLQLVDSGGGGRVEDSGDEGSSQLSQRSLRSQRFFSKCDDWLTKPGYCYTSIIRPSRRQAVAEKFGVDLRFDVMLKLPESDVAWDRMRELNVVRISNWRVHLTFDTVDGSESLLAHLAAFAADFPTIVPMRWLELVRGVVPASDSWFGIMTQFGATCGDSLVDCADSFDQQSGRRVEVVHSKSDDVDVVVEYQDAAPVVYFGTDSRVKYDGHDITYTVGENEHVELIVPVGAVLDDGFTVVADARLRPVKVLLLATSSFYLYGVHVDSLLVRRVDDTSAYEREFRVRDIVAGVARRLRVSIVPPLLIDYQVNAARVVALGFESDRDLWTRVFQIVRSENMSIHPEIVSIAAETCNVRAKHVDYDPGIDASVYRRSCLRYYEKLVEHGTIAGVFYSNMPLIVGQLLVQGMCFCGYDYQDDKMLLDRHFGQIFSALSLGDAKWQAIYTSDSNLSRVQYATVCG